MTETSSAAKKMTLRFWLFFGAGVVGLILLVALLTWFRIQSMMAGFLKGFPPTPIKAAFVVRKNVPLTLKAIGHVEAYSTVAVKSRVEGQIKEVHFQEGQNVKKGDLLFTIDSAPFQASLRLNQSNLERDRALALQAKKEVLRSEELLKKQFISQNEYESLQSKAEAAEATVKADEAAVENAKLQLAFCTIQAPISGRMGDLLTDAGNMVRTMDTSTMVVLTQVKPVYVAFAVPEQQLPLIRKYQEMQKGGIKVTALDSDGNRLAEGELSFMDNQVDRTTGTILLKGTFSNNDERLWPGQFVNVEMILTEQPGAITLPTRAVQKGPEGKIVFQVISARSEDFPIPSKEAQAAGGPGSMPVGRGFGSEKFSLSGTVLIAVPKTSLTFFRQETGDAVGEIPFQAADLDKEKVVVGRLKQSGREESGKENVLFFKADFSDSAVKFKEGQYIALTFQSPGIGSPSPAEKQGELLFVLTPRTPEERAKDSGKSPDGKPLPDPFEGISLKLTGPILIVKKQPVLEDRLIPDDETVLKSGLNPGDLVVTEGHLMLYPKAVVAVQGDLPKEKTKALKESDPSSEIKKKKTEFEEKTPSDQPTKIPETPLPASDGKK